MVREGEAYEGNVVKEVWKNLQEVSESAKDPIEGSFGFGIQWY